jgi:HD-like signal output (HDOD) protein
MNAHVIESIRKSAAVPTIPQVVTRFLEVVQDPNFRYDDVVKVLSADAGTVSEILRLANSALFGLPREVTSLRQALTLLGPKRTRSLVLGRCLVDRLNDYPYGRLDKAYFWRRSLVGSVLSARFADALAPDLREEAFVAGLLADIGVAILANALSDAYDPVVSEYRPEGRHVSEDEERGFVGATHAEVSAMILSTWGLPDPVCTAVNLHQSLTVRSTDGPQRVARILNAADRVARLLCGSPDAAETARTCAEAAAFIQVDLPTLARIVEEIETDVEQLAAVLRIDVIPDAAYVRVTKAIPQPASPV